MKFAHFFIHRPIFASVLSIITVVVGLISVFRLPVAQYPDIVPPTVMVSGFYPGANAEVIATTVVAPLEEEINGVEDMLYMASNADDGQFSIVVTPKPGTDLDKSQVLVQNRVSIAEPKLPEEVRRMGVTTWKQSPNITQVVQLLSPDNRYDELYLFNYALLNVKDLLARQPGVGQAMLFGQQNYAMRVWIDPDQAAVRNLTVGEVVGALREQNVQVAAGTFGQPPAVPGTALQLVAHTQGRLTTAEEFGQIVVQTDPDGRLTRLRDVARVELGPRQYNMKAFLNRVPTSALGVFQLPGSNAIETADAVRAALEELSRSFPPGLEYRITYDTTLFIRESVNEVIKTLVEATLLVVLVVLLFLQNWRASLIPLLAVPVSLIGTFAVMQALGFSINTLSLFGLVLAIGIVVDDAIVVVENVERNLALGLTPVAATRKAMDEVSGAVVAITLVLSAVFIPTAFITGFAGKFYQQFALTVATATLFSGFNSLTLSPALSALLLRHHSQERDALTRLLAGSLGWLFRGFNRCFEGSRRSYVGLVDRLVRKAGLALALYGGLLALTWLGFKTVPTGFVPQQDKGYLLAYLQLPDGASLERTEAVSARMAELFLGQPGVANVIEIPGMSMSFGPKPNTAIMFVPLQPFTERRKAGLSAAAIVAAMQPKLAGVQEGFATVFNAPPVDGIGALGGYRLQVQDKAGLGFAQLQMAVYQLIGATLQDPRLVNNFTMFRASAPQIYLEVDRAKAKVMNLHLQDLWDTLQVYLGSLYVNDFNLFGRTFQAVVQAEASFRDRPEDIRNLKTRTQSGQMVPLGAVVQVRETTGPTSVGRYNMYPTAEISGMAAPGVSSSEAMAALEGLAQGLLPPGMGYEWTELSLLERMSGNTTAFIFPLCVLMVFLVLAALYESWALPLAIILIVPLCILAALAGTFFRGLDNNIFTQIGFVVLVGLAAKNAILIVEFARQLEEQGQSRSAAALEACRLRLRPILMTSFAFIFGVLPLVFAQGAGAEMRQALGTAVCSGMLGVTFFGIFLTPVFYVVIRAASAWCQRRRRSSAAEPPSL